VQHTDEKESPPHGSFMYPMREKLMSPGPGYYEVQQEETDTSVQPWGRFGNQEQEKALHNLEMYNISNLCMGPGFYQVRHNATEVQAPQRRFSTLRSTRMWRCTDAYLPEVCHRDPRTAHGTLPLPDGQMFNDVKKSYEQGLKYRTPRSTVTRIDHASRQQRLEFHGAAWRLGGQLVIPTGSNAGPVKSVLPGGQAVLETFMVRQRAREAAARRVINRAAERRAGGGHYGFGQSRRF